MKARLTCKRPVVPVLVAIALLAVSSAASASELVVEERLSIEIADFGELMESVGHNPKVVCRPYLSDDGILKLVILFGDRVVVTDGSSVLSEIALQVPGRHSAVFSAAGRYMLVVHNGLQPPPDDTSSMEMIDLEAGSSTVLEVPNYPAIHALRLLNDGSYLDMWVPSTPEGLYPDQEATLSLFSSEGTLEWSHHLVIPSIGSFSSPDDGSVVVFLDLAENVPIMTCLSREGRTLWERELTRYLSDAPEVSPDGGLVLIAEFTEDERLVVTGVDGLSGSTVWNRGVEGSGIDHFVFSESGQRWACEQDIVLESGEDGYAVLMGDRSGDMTSVTVNLPGWHRAIPGSVSDRGYALVSLHSLSLPEQVYCTALVREAHGIIWMSDPRPLRTGLMFTGNARFGHLGPSPVEISPNARFAVCPSVDGVVLVEVKGLEP